MVDASFEDRAYVARPPRALRLWHIVRDVWHTCASLASAGHDWLTLCRMSRSLRPDTFAFLVHPRSDEFVAADVYGANDIYRPFPAFRWLFKILPEERARRFMLWFARTIVPITLSRIRVRTRGRTYYGYLLSTVRTPQQLFSGAGETKAHLANLFRLAAKKRVGRVGLGALLPSLTGYGKRFAVPGVRPAVSTGHAYTGYMIVEYLKLFVMNRNQESQRVRVAIVGAAGSTGKAVLRVLKKTWGDGTPLDLLLVDVERKESALEALAAEAGKAFDAISASTDIAAVRSCEYVIVVTNASGAIIRPEHLSPGTIVIDDSQPRNTTPALLARGCYVVDVLARVPGLDCRFDFGFRTSDPSVTFTCLAETVLATIAGTPGDLAVGEVTDEVVERMIETARVGEHLGLIGTLPFFSFGRELLPEERARILAPVPPKPRFAKQVAAK